MLKEKKVRSSTLRVQGLGKQVQGSRFSGSSAEAGMLPAP